MFDVLGAQGARLACNESNVRSWRVAEGCGFVGEGRIRQTHPDVLCADGTPSGDYLYGLLRAEYQRLQV
ncbi:MAG: GNAT family N-acetyltransferase [Chloroflexi bacterium]|nr:GNAT family N-acetyltransferase [Chloroflexota bacterium]